MLRKALLSFFFMSISVACGENVAGPTTVPIPDPVVTISPQTAFMEIGDSEIFTADGGTGTFDFIVTYPQSELFEISFPTKKQIKLKLVKNPYPFVRAGVIVYSGSQHDSMFIDFYR